jgi:adenylate kinase
MIIFMGIAGSGKSLQGRKLADTMSLPWLSTGEFLRMLVAGERRKDMLEGKLLEDSEIIAMVQKTFSLVDTQNEFVLDGFPRTSSQAGWLLSQVEYRQLDLTAIVHITAKRETVAKRLLERARPDDHEEAIEARFREYNNEIVPMLERFKEARIPVVEVSSEGPIEDVHNDIVEGIQSVKAKATVG